MEQMHTTNRLNTKANKKNESTTQLIFFSFINRLRSFWGENKNDGFPAKLRIFPARVLLIDQFI